MAVNRVGCPTTPGMVGRVGWRKGPHLYRHHNGGRGVGACWAEMGSSPLNEKTAVLLTTSRDG